jgi:hypothetical protein
MPDSYGMDFMPDFFFGPNKFPKPIAINATIVAKTIIKPIAMYSSILTPQNTLNVEFVLAGTLGKVYHKRF